MKTRIAGIVAASLLSSAGIANAAWYAKFDGVDGSSAQTERTQAQVVATTSSTVRAPSSKPEAASTDYLLKLDGVKGESASEPEPAPTAAPSRSKIESLPIKQGTQEDAGTAPTRAINPETGSAAKDNGHKNEIEILSNSVNPEPLMPDLSILLGGSGGEASSSVSVAAGDVNGLTEEKRVQIANILQQGLIEEGAPVEQVSLNFEKITVMLSHPLKLFGVLPVQASARAEIVASGKTSIHFPWWSFLASGKDTESLGSGVQNALAQVLTSKHDTIKNAIGNIR